MVSVNRIQVDTVYGRRSIIVGMQLVVEKAATLPVVVDLIRIQLCIMRELV